MKPNQIQDLVEKYLNDTATVDEQQRLSHWYSTTNPEKVEWLAEEENEELELKADMLHYINSRITRDDAPVKTRSWPWFRIAASAAAIFVAVGLGVYFYNAQNDKHNNFTVQQKHDIAPGTNKAFLTLADGRKISLTDANNGELAKEAGIHITKTKDGQLLYRASADQENSVQNAKYNTVETPNGGQYQIVLPDGTKVWLNAASSLRFPASFKSLNNRKVELSGEAYFEVTKNKAQPFIVKTDRQEVEVLGTHFNINSYRNENIVKTTLLEGSIKIAAVTPKGMRTEILKPGQQAAVDGKQLKVNEVDTEDAIDWKNGYFQLNNENLENIMLKISRWYNIEVIYQDPEVKKETFQGTVSRDEKVSKVLSMLQRTGVVRFSIEGRVITVHKK